MSSSEIGHKRSITEDTEITTKGHKVQKLEQTSSTEITQPENNVDNAPAATDNNEEDKIDTNTQVNEVENSTSDSKLITKDEKSSNTIEPEAMSADLTKTVTQIQEDASITSEQLLMALTSIPPDTVEPAAPVGNTSTAANEKEVVSTDQPVVKEAATTIPIEQEVDMTEAPLLEEPIKENDTALAAEDQIEATVTHEDKGKAPTLSPTQPLLLSQEAEVKAPNEPLKEETVKASPSSPTIVVQTPQSTPSPLATPITGLGMSPKDDAKPTISTPQTHIGSPLKHVSAPTSGVSSPLKFNNHADASSLSATLSAAPNISISNLPDIKAALRRLSSANVSASVIEQLSASPRLPTIGQLNERKGSVTDVSPSEILGNALAAVAANAAAARSNQQNTTKTPPQPSTSSNTNTNAAATAIGNLAAITANISNLLHSGGFHRNSFSQEDTQKLAAAVAVARNNNNQQQSQREERRKSSIALVGNAFSSMIDQAIMMGRKSISEGNTHHFQKSSHYSPTPASPKPKLIVKNEQVWKLVEGIEETHLGYQLYSPHLLLPNLENKVNGVMEIRVPARFLTFENMQVQKCAVWGTDIYTDDSDIVAMIIHSGKYQPKFIEPVIDASDPFALAVAGKQKESLEAAKKLAFSGKQYIHRHDHLIPDHDLKVTVRVLPKLQRYTSSIRHKLKSRDWHQHDGMSLYVDKVEEIKRGDAKLKGRSSLKSNMFAYEAYRKKALSLNEKVNTTDNQSTSVHKGRVKKTSRVLRMFKLHSDLKKA